MVNTVTVCYLILVIDYHLKNKCFSSYHLVGMDGLQD